MYFKDVIGQEDVKARLIQSARTGAIPHAQLFTGSSGSGAFPLALAYARYLNCTERSEADACGKCPSCLKFDELVHPDLHFVFPIVSKKEKKKEACDDYLSEWRKFLLEGNGYFSIDGWLEEIDAGNSQALIYSKDSDEIIRKLNLRIYEADYRILFVWLPEKMHITCANKLLKVIEEPPGRTVILMVSEEPGLIISTVLSRVQRIHVKPIEEPAIVGALCKEGLSDEDARRVAHLSGGSYIRAIEAISLAEERNFFLEQFKSMMRNSWARNVKNMKELADSMAGMGRERQKNFLAYCQHLIRENFMYRFQAPDITYMDLGETSFSNNFAPYVNERNVFGLMDELACAERDISQNVNAKMVFFDLCLKLTVLIKR